MGSTGQGCKPCSWSAEKGKVFSLCPRSRRRIWSRKTGSDVPSRVSLLILQTQAEPGGYSWVSPAFRDGVIVHLFIPPTAIGSVPSLSGRAIAYSLRSSLPRVRRHRDSSPQGSSSKGCCLFKYAPVSPWYQFLCAALFPHMGA